MKNITFRLKAARDGAIEQHQDITLTQMLAVMSEAKWKNKNMGKIYLNVNITNPDDRYYSMQGWCDDQNYIKAFVCEYNKRTDTTRIIFDILNDMEKRNMM